MRLLALRAETMQAVRLLKLPCDDITPMGLWGSDMFLIGVNNEQFEVLRAWNVQTEDVTPASLQELHTESPAVPTSPSAGNTASGARPSATVVPRMATAVTASKPAPSPVAPRSTPAATPNPGVTAAAWSATTVAAAAASAPPQVVDRTAEAPATSGRDSALASNAVASSIGNGAAAPVSITPAPERRDGPALTLQSNTTTTSSRISRNEERKQETAKVAPPEPLEPGASALETKDGNAAAAGKLRMTVDGEHMYAEIKGGKIQLKDRTYDSLAHARDSIRRERNKVAVWEYFDEGVKSWRVLNRD